MRYQIATTRHGLATGLRGYAIGSVAMFWVIQSASRDSEGGQGLSVSMRCMTRQPSVLIALIVAGILMAAGPARAQDDASHDLAKKLQNQVADLISVLLQSNWDFGIGHANAMRYTLRSGLGTSAEQAAPRV